MGFEGLKALLAEVEANLTREKKRIQKKISRAIVKFSKGRGVLGGAGESQGSARLIQIGWPQGDFRTLMMHNTFSSLVLVLRTFELGNPLLPTVVCYCVECGPHAKKSI